MENKIGHVIHYFNNIGVAVIYLSKKLQVGDSIHFLGSTTDFVQEVASMEVAHKQIHTAKPGGEVALKVDESVRGNDDVFLVKAK
jgi:translation elongation factor EF-1alpha